MHWIQARMLAHGRLWMPAHPLPQFFETFHIFVTPLYAPMQFPGTSLLYVPAVWLALPYSITPLLIAGATLGLIYRIIGEIIDGVAGLLAAVILLGMLGFPHRSAMGVFHPAGLTIALSLI